MLLKGSRDGQISGADSIAASPGFRWGKSGSVTSDTYLLNDTVPSNLNGTQVLIYDGIISEVSFFGEYGDTYTAVLALEKRNGASWTELLTVTLTAERGKIESFTTAVDRGDELAVKVKSGSVKNPIVTLIIKGDTA